MANKKEIISGIIIIGNEILSGRTKDLNTSTLSKWFNSIGIKVVEVSSIPDIEEIINDGGGLDTDITNFKFTLKSYIDIIRIIITNKTIYD